MDKRNLRLLCNEDVWNGDLYNQLEALRFMRRRLSCQNCDSYSIALLGIGKVTAAESLNLVKLAVFAKT